MSSVRGRKLLSRSSVVVAGSLMLAACATGGGIFGSREPEFSRTPPTGDTPPKVQTTTIAKSSIPVLVNDQPITRYDIDQRSKLMRLGGVSANRKAATEELINETVQMIEAARRRVEVHDEQVEAAYTSIGSGLKMSPKQLDSALQSEGIAPESLKRRLRAQIAWQRLVQARSRTETRMSSSDLVTELRARGDPESITLTEYYLQQIVFVVPTGSARAKYTQRRSEANAFRQRYQGCDSALDQAKKLSAVVVKDLGRRSTDQLRGPQGEAIRDTAAGETTPPNRIEQGIELIGICSTREVRSNAAARLEIENKYAIEQAEDLGKDYLKELREAAIIDYR